MSENVHETIARVLRDYDTGARLCARYKERIQDIEQLQADRSYLAERLRDVLFLNRNARDRIDKLEAENKELGERIKKLTSAGHTDKLEAENKELKETLAFPISSGSGEGVWVPTSERTPPVGTGCRVNLPSRWCARWDGTSWVDPRTGHVFERVTHWEEGYEDA